MVNREDIITRIQALRARASDAASSEAEAEAAARIAAKIIAEHSVTEEELRERGASGVNEGAHNAGRRTQHRALEVCAFQIDGLTECQSLRRRGELSWVGQPEDVAFALYLCELIQGAADRSYKIHRDKLGRSPSTSYRRDFMTGFGSAMRECLSRMANERKAARAEASSTGTDIVIVKHALIADFMTENYPAIKSHNPRQSNRMPNPYAFFSGSRAASSVNISRPLEDENEAEEAITEGCVTCARATMRR